MTSPAPDRELDRRVAERIFDRHLVSNTSICHCPKEHILEAQPYSTDPAAMMQVIEKMREKGFRVELGDTQTDGWDWYAGFFKDDKVVGNQTGTSLMKCVCLAACAAVEGGRETK